MGILESGFALFEYTGQKLLDLYDIIVSTPSIVKVLHEKNKRNTNRKKGNQVKWNAKDGIQKRSHKHFRVESPKTSPTKKSEAVLKPKDPISTPKPTLVVQPAATPAPDKVKKLEGELNKLRDEINRLMAVKEAPKETPKVGGAAGTISFVSQHVVPPSFVPTNLDQSSIPPPPPPPPSFPETPSKARAPQQPPSTPKEGPAVISTRQVQRKGSMSLAEVLRGASSLNLKKTEVSRSPGGTPLDAPVKPKPVDASDPQQMIADALKKKFLNLRQSMSPEAAKNRSQIIDDEWECEEPSEEGNTGRTPKGKVADFNNDENIPPPDSNILASPKRNRAVL